MIGCVHLWPSRFLDSPHISARQYGRMLRGWVAPINLEPSATARTRCAGPRPRRSTKRPATCMVLVHERKEMKRDLSRGGAWRTTWGCRSPRRHRAVRCRLLSLPPIDASSFPRPCWVRGSFQYRTHISRCKSSHRFAPTAVVGPSVPAGRSKEDRARGDAFQSGPNLRWGRLEHPRRTQAARRSCSTQHSRESAPCGTTEVGYADRAGFRCAEWECPSSSGMGCANAIEYGP